MACLLGAAVLSGKTFLEVVGTMVSAQRLQALCDKHTPVPRRAPKLQAWQVLTGLIFHQLQPAGALAAHATQLHGVPMSDSAHAQRRRVWPQELFDELMQAALRPVADPRRHPTAFYRGLRLVGVDGTEFSASNTPAICRALPKAASRRFEAAFAKLRLVSLVELGVHNPLAAVSGPSAQAELALAAKLWAAMPDDSLLIADRLFGTARTLHDARQAWAGRRVECLVRIKKNLRSVVVERLGDGSAVVEIKVEARDDQPAAVMRLREIRAEGVGRDGKRFALRFWTTLLDQVAYPAQELAELYARRWEQELFYRELKLDVRGTSLLTSHTEETAHQEIAALVLATAVAARVRVAAADHLEVPPARVSFRKLLIYTQQLWQSLNWGRRSRTAAQTRDIVEDYLRSVQAYALLPERRPRSCPRAVRQPVKKWPRKLLQPACSGQVTLTITPLS